MNDIMFRALVGVCFLLALFGLCAITKPHREKPRNVRRESGNTVPRRPNVRRPTASLATSNTLDADWAESVSAATLTQGFPCANVWADDEVTKVGGAA